MDQAVYQRKPGQLTDLELIGVLAVGVSLQSVSAMPGA